MTSYPNQKSWPWRLFTGCARPGSGKLVLGFLPILGPIAAYRLDVALALRFYDLATEYFRELKSAGIRPLPDDFAIPRPPRTHRHRKNDGSPDSVRRTVERFLAKHRTEEHLHHVRGMARIGESARAARWIAGSSGLFTNLIPIRHLQFRFRDLNTHMFLTMLQAIWWQAAANAGREDDPGDDFERLLLRWAGAGQDDEAPASEPLIAAVSAKLQPAYLWKLAFGFLPLIGAIMSLMIDGAMAARLYRPCPPVLRATTIAEATRGPTLDPCELIPIPPRNRV